MMYACPFKKCLIVFFSMCTMLLCFLSCVEVQNPSEDERSVIAKSDSTYVFPMGRVYVPLGAAVDVKIQNLKTGFSCSKLSSLSLDSLSPTTWEASIQVVWPASSTECATTPDGIDTSLQKMFIRDGSLYIKGVSYVDTLKVVNSAQLKSTLSTWRIPLSIRTTLQVKSLTDSLLMYSKHSECGKWSYLLAQTPKVGDTLLTLCKQFYISDTLCEPDTTLSHVSWADSISSCN